MIEKKCPTNCETFEDAISNICLACLLSIVEDTEFMSHCQLQEIASLSSKLFPLTEEYTEKESARADSFIFILFVVSKRFPDVFEESFVFHEALSRFPHISFLEHLYDSFKDHTSFELRNKSDNGILPLAHITTSELKQSVPAARSWSEETLFTHLQKYALFFLCHGVSPNDPLDDESGASVIYQFLRAGDLEMFKFLFVFSFPKEKRDLNIYNKQQSTYEKRSMTLIQFMIEEGYDKAFELIAGYRSDEYGMIIQLPMILLDKEEDSSIKKICRMKDSRYRNIVRINNLNRGAMAVFLSQQ